MTRGQLIIAAVLLVLIVTVPVKAQPICRGDDCTGNPHHGHKKHNHKSNDNRVIVPIIAVGAGTGIGYLIGWAVHEGHKAEPEKKADPDPTRLTPEYETRTFTVRPAQ